MRIAPLLIIAATPLVLGGCLARTAVGIVTLPVRAVSAGVDAMTTSQAEADRNEGRRLREEDERRGREARTRAREAERARARGEHAPEDQGEAEPHL